MERAGVRAGFKPKLNCISEFSDRLSEKTDGNLFTIVILDDFFGE